jgi:hypothetical protein
MEILIVMPVEQLVGDLPLSIDLEKTENVRGAAVHACEFA